MKLAFIGLGHMGQGMAARLLQAGQKLCVYNRSQEKCRPLERLGAKVAVGPGSAVSEADIVFTILTDDAALSAVMTEEVIKAMQPGAVHISMSTISPELAENLTSAHTNSGSVYLSCPVFGRPDAAAAGELKLCICGPKEYKNKVAPVLAPLGEVWDFGESVSGSNAVKLAGNFMLAALIELLGEAYSFVEKHDIKAEDFYNLISNTLFAAPAVRNYGRLILEADYDNPGLSTKLGAKDMRLVRDASRRKNIPMPIAALVEDRFLRALARGWAEKDWTVIARGQFEDAGLVEK